MPAFVARTGYTGEDGFELFVDWDAAVPVWDRLLPEGRGLGIMACGLGARDTLRLEAGMPLYGNELDRDTNPYDAGLGRVVKLDKPGDFVGRAALERVAEAGPRKQLVGMVVQGRGIARHGYPLHMPGDEPMPVSSPAARRRQRWACRSPWATCRRPTPRSVPWWKSPSAAPGSTRRSSRYPSTSAPT